jgi:hypothetical protein
MMYTFYIRSAFLCEPIGGVKISAIDNSGNILHHFFTDQNENFDFSDSSKIKYLVLKNLVISRRQSLLMKNQLIL